MKINETKKGESVFIDTNIFVYFLTKQRVYYTDCLKFFNRIEQGELAGFVNQFVLAEVLFSITNHQIIVKNNLKANEVVRFVKNNPGCIRDVDVSEVIAIFESGNFNFTELSTKYILSNYKRYHNYSLHSNDIFHLLSMKLKDIENIATNDSDFEQVPLLKVWKP